MEQALRHLDGWEFHVGDHKKCFHPLYHNGTGADKQHSDCEERIPPRFVQEPQSTAEELEEREWLDQLLPEQLAELGEGDHEAILSVDVHLSLPAV